MLPKEWRDTMRPLQDTCDPTPYEDVQALFLSDMGHPISELFEDFDPVPIGVASLAQVHTGKHRESGKKVAVKVCLLDVKQHTKPFRQLTGIDMQVQHPFLAEFCDIDMEMVEVTLGERKFQRGSRRTLHMF